MAVAKQGRDKDLDILVHDESCWVREIVVQQGRPQDLVILANDDDTNIRKSVREYKGQHPDWNKHKDEKIKDVLQKVE